MPYIHTWREPDKNPNLNSSLELPEGYEESNINFGYRSARRVMEQGGFQNSESKPYNYHYCKGDILQDKKPCGWVEGDPNSYEVNTMGVLSGRQGTDYHCAKCGSKIGFVGCYS